MTVMIKTNGLTKDYGKGRGIFDLNLEISKGEVFGLVGINGAGKTTLLRLLMGFLKPSKGMATIHDRDSWKSAAELKKYIGYVPGEIAFPDTKSGQTFLKMQMELLKMSRHDQHVNELIQKLKIDTTADIKRMSKGMKQKVALVCAFMSEAEILLLDEPTTGLDPVMRDVFIELVRTAKKRGTTIIMSSHMFNELEPTCDRIAFLKNGRIINMIDKEEKERLTHYQKIEITTADMADFTQLINQSEQKPHKQNDEQRMVSFITHENDTMTILSSLDSIKISDLTIIPFGLDGYFATELESH